jgi:hypothetical protein
VYHHEGSSVASDVKGAEKQEIEINIDISQSYDLFSFEMVSAAEFLFCSTNLHIVICGFTEHERLDVI